MAFLKRTWLARLGTGLNKFLIGDKGADGKQTLTSSPDTVIQEGDVISADNLNDLEDRIKDGFDDLETALDGKQDVLTFDSTPIQGSNNPVTSGGIFTSLGIKLSQGDFMIKEFTVNNPWTGTIQAGSQKSATIPTATEGYRTIGLVGWEIAVVDSNAGTYGEYSIQRVYIANSGNVIMVLSFHEALYNVSSTVRVQVLLVRR